jgi:uncharacterized LabA/DUF88 family protein
LHVWGMCMDRCVLLVDAGYLFAQGGYATHGTKARHRLVLDPSRLISELKSMVEQHSGMALLRTYWYDGAQGGIPTAEHQRIARVPFVKLRMGRINNANQQKGVDALIYRDLMTLATERAVSEAYLLSGDDDLREGVIFAQDRGMRVSLIGISHKGKTNQSQELFYEVDDRMNLSQDILNNSLTLIPLQPSLLTLGNTIAPAALPGPVGVAEAAEPATLRGAPSIGREYGHEWWGSAKTETRASVLQAAPVIPKTLDVDLIRFAERDFGRSLRGEETTKRDVRRGFWEAIRIEDAASHTSQDDGEPNAAISADRAADSSSPGSTCA